MICYAKATVDNLFAHVCSSYREKLTTIWSKYFLFICVCTTYCSKLWPRHKWCYSDLDLWPMTSKIKSIHPWVTVELCIKLEQIPSKRLLNIYKLSINIWLQWPCPLTCDLQNLNRSSLSPSGPLHQIWRIYLKAFPRYYVLKYGPDKRDVTVTLTFDPWPPKSNEFILESQWTFVQSLKKIPQSVLEIRLFTRNADVRMDSLQTLRLGPWLSPVQRHKNKSILGEK